MVEFENVDRYRCLEALKLLADHSRELPWKISNQRLVDCMMDDCSDLNVYDQTLSGFFELIGIMPSAVTTLADVKKALSNLGGLLSSKINCYGHLLDRILIANSHSHEAEHLNQVFKYLQAPDLSTLIKASHSIEIDNKTLSCSKVEIDSYDSNKYKLSMKYVTHNCEDPMEYEIEAITKAYFGGDTFVEVFEALESVTCKVIAQIEKDFETNDETVFDLMSIDIMRGNRALVSFPFDTQLTAFRGTTFSLTEQIAKAHIVAGSVLLNEVASLPSDSPWKHMLKGRVLEQDLGM